MEAIQPYLDYFSANPEWALLVIFLIAFGEALLIIGLFVPSTATLVGAGMLVGTGHLPFWPVFWATAVGCIMGDQVSYWAGRMFGDRLKTMWPLVRYPSLVQKGEDFVKSHGGKSIAIGRFVPGVKAVIPGIVGMLGMNQAFFVAVNISSGLVWAIAHIVPGVLIGQGLAIAGEFSGRLVVILLVLLVILGVLGWLTRLVSATFLSPLSRKFLQSVSGRLKSFRVRPAQRLARNIAPDHPRSSRLLKFGLVAVIGLVVLLFLLFGILRRDNASNLDQSVFSLLSELRSSHGDDLMMPLTMLADGWVMTAMFAGIIVWLLLRRAWMLALAVLALVAVQQFLTNLLKYAVGRERPLDILDPLGSFPSGHTAVAALAFGVLALLVGHNMGRWSRACLLAAAAMATVVVGFTRVYLGAHWLSDVLAGAMLSTLLLAVFPFVMEAYPARRLRPIGMLGFALLALMAAWSVHLSTDLEKANQIYGAKEAVRTFTSETWANSGWREEPQGRVDLSGSNEEPFLAQWVGSIEQLTKTAEAAGFKADPKWSWQQGLIYFDPHANFKVVPPRPSLHRGLKARLTASRFDTTLADGRLVLRAYKTNAEVITAAGPMPVFLLSLVQEDNQPRFGLFTMPRTSPADEASKAEFLAGLQRAGQLLPIAGSTSPMPVVVASP